MIVFSDLDGTLLDHDTYSFDAAMPAMLALRERGIPLVLVTSKTRAEVLALRERMGHRDPFIVENGGAAVIPGGEDMVFGTGILQVREALRAASAASGVRVRGFGEMPADEICARSGLAPAVAELAARREFGEPFVVLDGELAALTEELQKLGFRVTRGGRFFHVLGGCDKARAVRAVAEQLGDWDTLGLGDAPNDIGFLREMRRAVIVPSAHLDVMRTALPEALIGKWNEAVLGALG